MLFKFVLKKVIKEANINRSGLIYYRQHQCLEFAEGIPITARNKIRNKNEKQSSQSQINYHISMGQKQKKYGQKKNIRGWLFVKKTENRKIEKVDNFKYLGRVFNTKYSIREEI